MDSFNLKKFLIENKLTPASQNKKEEKPCKTCKRVNENEEELNEADQMHKILLGKQGATRYEYVSAFDCQKAKQIALERNPGWTVRVCTTNMSFS